MKIEVQVEGGENFKKMADLLGKMPDELREARGRGLFKSMTHIRSRVLLSGRVPHKTGTLRRSITTSVSVSAGEGRIGSNLPYAAIHELGGKVERFSAFGRPTRPYTATYKARKYISIPLEDSLDEVREIIDGEVGSVFEAA